MSTSTALVTGANRGIGAEIVRQLSTRGWRVFLGSRSVAAGEKAAAEMGDNVSVVELDVCDPGSIAKALREITGEIDSLDVLVNNAGVILDGDTNVLTLAPETMHGTFDTNTVGVLRVTQAFVPLLRKSARPRIINVSSTAGQLGGGLQTWAPAYSISKTALNALTQHLAAALPEIAVNSMSPGWVRTDMGGAGAPRSVSEGAETVVWLAAEAPQSLTGKFLRDRAVIEW